MSRSIMSRRVASLNAVGGVAWIATAFVSWTRRGNGSTLRGMRLARWLRTGILHPWWGPLAAVSITVIAFAGCAVVATCVLGHRVVAIARAGLGCIAVLTLAYFGLSGRWPLTNWGIACWLLISGAVILIVAAFPQRDTSS